MAGSVPETRRGGRWIVAALAVALLAAIAGVTFVASATGPAPPSVRTGSTADRSDPPAAARTRVRAHSDSADTEETGGEAGPASAEAAGRSAADVVVGRSWCGGVVEGGGAGVLEIRDEQDKVLTWAPIEKGGRFAFVGPPVVTNPADASDVRVVVRHPQGETQFRTLARDVSVRLPEDWCRRHDLRLVIPRPAATRTWIRVVWQDGSPASGIVVGEVGDGDRLTRTVGLVAEGVLSPRAPLAADARFGVAWGMNKGDAVFHTFRVEAVVDGRLVLPFAPPAKVTCDVVDHRGAPIPGVLVWVSCADVRQGFVTNESGRIWFLAHPAGEAHRLDRQLGHATMPGSRPGPRTGLAAEPARTAEFEPLVRRGNAPDGAEVWEFQGSVAPNVRLRFRDAEGAVVRWRRFEAEAPRRIEVDAPTSETTLWLPPGSVFLRGTFTYADAPPQNADVTFTVPEEGVVDVEVVSGEWRRGGRGRPEPYLLIDLGLRYFDGTVPTSAHVDAAPAAMQIPQPAQAQSPGGVCSHGLGVPPWTTPTSAGRFRAWTPVAQREVVLWIRTPLSNVRIGPYVVDPERRVLQMDLRLPRPAAYLGRVVDASGKPRAGGVIAYTASGTGGLRWGDQTEAIVSSEGFWLIPFADAPKGIDLWWVEDRMADDGRATRTLHSLARDVRPDENAGILELVVPGPASPAR